MVRRSFPELLTKLSEIEGIEWIRLLYCYPEEITDELIEVMATNPKICHYVDIPIHILRMRYLREWADGPAGRTLWSLSAD